MTHNIRLTLIIASIIAFILCLVYIGINLYNQFYFDETPISFSDSNSLINEYDKKYFIDIKWHPTKNELVVLRIDRQTNDPEVFQIDANTGNISSKLNTNKIEIINSINNINIYNNHKTLLYFNTYSGPFIIYFNDIGEIQKCEYYNQKGIQNFMLSPNMSFLCYTNNSSTNLSKYIFIRKKDNEQIFKYKCFPENIYYIDKNSNIYFSTHKMNKSFKWINLNDLNYLNTLGEHIKLLNHCIYPKFKDSKIAYWRYSDNNLSLWLKYDNIQEVKIDEFQFEQDNRFLPGISWVPMHYKLAFISYSKTNADLNIFDINNMTIQTIINDKKLCGPIKFSCDGKYILYFETQMDNLKINILKDNKNTIDITYNILSIGN